MNAKRSVVIKTGCGGWNGTSKYYFVIPPPIGLIKIIILNTLLGVQVSKFCSIIILIPENKFQVKPLQGLNLTHACNLSSNGVKTVLLVSPATMMRTCDSSST